MGNNLVTTTESLSSLGQMLSLRGWQQGSLFQGQSVRFVSSMLNADEAIEQKARPTKAAERFVLISQDCDLISKDEPYVEALICQPEKSITHIGPNSARWFIVDPDRRLVAQAKYRITIAKEVLMTFVPESWPNTIERRRDFVRWLGRRFTRPAIDDGIVRAFQRPLNDILLRLRAQQPELRAAFSRAVHEIRVKLPSIDTLPYKLDLLLVLEDELSSEEADSISIVMGIVRADLDPKLVRLGPDTLATKDDISMRTYLDTTPIFLEQFTEQGDDIEEAPPLGPG